MRDGDRELFDGNGRVGGPVAGSHVSPRSTPATAGDGRPVQHVVVTFAAIDTAVVSSRLWCDR